MNKENENPLGQNANDLAYQQAVLLEKQLEEIAQFNKKINSDFTGFLSSKQELLDLEDKIYKRTQLIAKEENDGHKELVAYHKQLLEFDTKTLANQQLMLKNTSLWKIGINTLVNNSLPSFSTLLGDVVEYINKADGAFKDLNKTLGLSGAETDILRNNLVSASALAASIGINFEDLAKLQDAYNSQMGTSVLLGKESLENISKIAAGTMMGAEQAGIMTAKFQNMGISVAAIKDFYKDTVNESAQFGVSANEVIKKINDNLDKSQRYVFKGGVNGLKQMAEYATKFNIDMSGVFNAMDKANSLEGAVDMVAQLQVIGGKFAQANPFKLLFESRNDAVAFTHDIQSMTNGMATFNRTANDGKGQIQIAAGDLNRLRLAADATGISYDDLIKQAKRGKEINMIDQMIGPGITGKQKDFIESVAQMRDGGKFTIEMPNGMAPKDIANLTSGEIDKLMSTNKNLEDRAKDAMTFDKLMISTINEMKSALLPVLTFIDKMLVQMQGPWLKGLMWVGAGLISLGGIGKIIQTAVAPIKLIMATVGKGAGGIAAKTIESGAPSVETKIMGNAGNVGKDAQVLAQGEKEVGVAAGGAWKNMLAFGAAVAEIGAGIWLATEGIAAMGNSFKGLNATQLGAVEIVLGELVVSMGAMALLAPALGAASPELAAFGVGVGLIGAGVGIAAAGIGLMAEGFGDLFVGISKAASPQIVDNLGRLMLALGALAGEALVFANPLTWIGLKVMTSGIEDIGDKLKDANFQNLAVGAVSFENIASAIDKINDKKLDKLIQVSEGLSGIGSIAAIFGNLANSLGEGVEVRFAKDKVNLVVDVTAEMDGVQLGRKVSKEVALSLQRSQTGHVT